MSYKPFLLCSGSFFIGCISTNAYLSYNYVLISRDMLSYMMKHNIKSMNVNEYNQLK
jgi:hypothetical protein